MGQYMPRLAAIRLSSVGSRSRPQLRTAIRAHGLTAASGLPAGVAFTAMATIGAPVVLVAGLASSYSAHTSSHLTGTAN
jgi:ABC-type nitrate/sulfonate/bicarbonate transport system substrate-binding protein